MALVEEMIAQLTKYEGLWLKPYKCPAGYITIGIGRNLETKGISGAEAIYLATNDIEECIEDLEIIFDWQSIDHERKKVLIDMRFNLGTGGFRSFKKLIAAIKAGDYRQAAAEMKDSTWFRQVGYRAVELHGAMEV